MRIPSSYREAAVRATAPGVIVWFSFILNAKDSVNSTSSSSSFDFLHASIAPKGVGYPVSPGNPGQHRHRLGGKRKDLYEEDQRDVFMKPNDPKLATVAEKIADAKEVCLTRLRAVPREKRDAVAESIIALADPEWWERRHKGAEVFLLILELRKDAVLEIIQKATHLNI